VKKYGVSSNLLWMGRGHEIKDFYKERSGFRVVGVTLEDDLDYSIDLANRDSVPDYLEGVIEASILEAREV